MMKSFGFDFLINSMNAEFQILIRVSFVKGDLFLKCLEKPKPSLKIKTDNAILWIYLGVTA